MLYGVDIPVLLRRLVVAWEQQIAESEETFPPCSIKLPIPQHPQLALRHNPDGTLQIVTAATDAIDLGIALTDSDFWQLLFGEIGWEQLSGEASVPENISDLLQILFPKRDVIFWSPDRF